MNNNISHCAQAHKHTYKLTYAYTSPHTHTNTHTHTSTYIHKHAYKYTYIRTRKHAFITHTKTYNHAFSITAADGFCTIAGNLLAIKSICTPDLDRINISFNRD